MDVAAVVLPVVAGCMPLCRLTLAWMNTSGIHYIVVHLDAHSSVNRLVEAKVVASRVTALTAAGETVVVMGDMNTLSPRDQEWHREEKLVEFLQDERVRALLAWFTPRRVP